MSPENSETEAERAENDTNDSDSEDDENNEQGQRKKIVRRPLSWRSRSFTDHLASLDRKWGRRATVRSKAMAKVRHQGNILLCEPPEGIPDWMKRH
jgi:hypothetical protein